MELKQQEPGPISFWSPLRIVSTIIVIGLLAAFGVTSCNSNDPEPSGPVSTAKPASGPVGTTLLTVPAVVLDTEMQSTNGEPIKLSNYSGKVVVLNLWATWCGPCRNETPELVRLYKEYQDQGVEVVALTTEDPVRSAETVQQFVKEYKVNYPVGWATREVAVALMQGRGSIPENHMSIDKNKITTQDELNEPAPMDQADARAKAEMERLEQEAKEEVAEGLRQTDEDDE